MRRMNISTRKDSTIRGLICQELLEAPMNRPNTADRRPYSRGAFAIYVNPTIM